TDGTTAGTTLVRTNGTAGTPATGVMIAHNNRLWFGAPGLFSSDGTAAGTVLLAGSIRPQQSAIGGSDVFTHDGGSLFRCTLAGAFPLAALAGSISGLVSGGPNVYFDRTTFTAPHGVPQFTTDIWRADATGATPFVTSPQDASLLQVSTNAVWFAVRS